MKNSVSVSAYYQESGNTDQFNTSNILQKTSDQLCSNLNTDQKVETQEEKLNRLQQIANNYKSIQEKSVKINGEISFALQSNKSFQERNQVIDAWINSNENNLAQICESIATDNENISNFKIDDNTQVKLDEKGFFDAYGNEITFYSNKLINNILQNLTIEEKAEFNLLCQNHPGLKGSVINLVNHYINNYIGAFMGLPYLKKNQLINFYKYIIFRYICKKLDQKINNHLTSHEIVIGLHQLYNNKKIYGNHAIQFLFQKLA